MLIWLGKQWLGQSEKIDNKISGGLCVMATPLDVDL